ncbi:hypothetical protein SBOR_8707 [Sclerotinia borealis F-4128]|uniref:Uncharacterized protein n=1 Tax=Sclerotinia borealis (strain F-4128) TaxID=1432307 RepID=W9C8M7_SCLBF|nr:hypothetical protein SBOR_8707 [Sclerotinia borealis F-4128]
MSRTNDHDDHTQINASEATAMVSSSQAAVFEKMLSSLERIEGLMERNANAANKKDTSPDESFRDCRTKKHQETNSQPESLLYRAAYAIGNSFFPASSIHNYGPKLCTVNDIPGYQDLPTCLAEFPPDSSGWYHLTVSKYWLERQSLENAKRDFKESWQLLQKMQEFNRTHLRDYLGGRIRIDVIDHAIADADATAFDENGRAYETCMVPIHYQHHQHEDANDISGPVRTSLGQRTIHANCIVYYRYINNNQDGDPPVVRDNPNPKICRTIICRGLFNVEGDFDGFNNRYLLLGHHDFKRMVKDHLACFTETENIFDTNFFEPDEFMGGSCQSETEAWRWKSGELFPDQGQKSGWGYRRKNIKIIHWTVYPARVSNDAVLALIPLGGTFNSLWTARWKQTPRHKTVIFSLLVISATDAIISCWKALEIKMIALLSTDQLTDFMDPGEYVHQLYDRANFSKSRFYFWAIGCLMAFDDQISLNIEAIDKFANPKAWYWRGTSIDPELAKDIANNREKLAQIRQQFRKDLKRLESLRDGLYNGSTVMESRQSRVLGENVRLLTFVSIFFLPLGFCASVWSVPSVNARWPDLRIMAIAATVFTTFTISIVCNLDRLIWLLKKTLESPRNKLIARMPSHGTASKTLPERRIRRSKHMEPKELSQQEKDIEKWANRAKSFEPFPRSDLPSRPTHWWLFMFAIKLCVSYIALQISRLKAWSSAKANVLLKNITRTFTSTERVIPTGPENTIHAPDDDGTVQRNASTSAQAIVPPENNTPTIHPEPLQQINQNSSLADLTSVVVGNDGGVENDSLSIAMATPLPASDSISL